MVKLVVLNEENFIEKLCFKCTLEELNNLVNNLQIACKAIEDGVKKMM